MPDATFPEVICVGSGSDSKGFRAGSITTPGDLITTPFPHLRTYFQDVKGNYMSGVFVEFELGDCGKWVEATPGATGLTRSTAQDRTLEENQWSAEDANIEHDLTFYVALVNRAYNTSKTTALTTNVTLEFEVFSDNDDETLRQSSDVLRISKDGQALNVPGNLFTFVGEALKPGSSNNLTFNEFQTAQCVAETKNAEGGTEGNKWRVELEALPNVTSLYKFTVEFGAGNNATSVAITVKDKGATGYKNPERTMQCTLFPQPKRGNLACHPAGSMVTRLKAVTELPQQVPIEHINVGDVVLSDTDTYEPVIAIVHSKQTRCKYYEFSVAEKAGSLCIAFNHYLYCNGTLRAPQHVNVGDCIVYKGVPIAVTKIDVVDKEGAYHLTVSSGKLVVNDYTTSVHMANFPLWMQTWVTTPILYLLFMIGCAVDCGKVARTDRGIALFEYYGKARPAIKRTYGDVVEGVCAAIAGIALVVLLFLPEFVLLCLCGVAMYLTQANAGWLVSAAACRYAVTHVAWPRRLKSD